VRRVALVDQRMETGRNDEDFTVGHRGCDRIRLNPNDVVMDVWGATRGGQVFTGTDVVTIVD
jgi:hypothetical protein